MSDDAIVPDTKDWTWVLERPCPECGFDASTLDVQRVADLVRDNARRWEDLLANEPVPRLRARPSPSTWSALEYACHVRDVFRLYDARLELMLTEDDPLFANWDQDETAVTDRYSHQDPAEVGHELAVAAGALARRFSAVSEHEWARRGRRSDGAAFTVDTFGRYFVHDPIHHMDDVEKGLARLAGGG